MSGFPPGKFDSLPLPPGFYGEVLPAIDDLAELKVLLFCFWALPQKEGRFRYLRRQDFANHAPLLRGLAAVDPQAAPETTLDAAIQRCIERGTLLAVPVDLGMTTEMLYFVNTDQGRLAVEQIQTGRWLPSADDDPVEILPERPNIYTLYEQNIGPLVSHAVDQLKDMEKDYPLEWIEAAIRLAVERNARHLRFIQAVLKRRRAEGDGERTDKDDGLRYFSGEYADFIEH